MRIIADHLRAATFIIADGVSPSNVEQGYVLRRLIRRAIRYGRALQLNEVFTPKVAQVVVNLMAGVYPELQSNKAVILELLNNEEEKFSQTLNKGLREFEKLLGEIGKEKILPGSRAFFLYETYGFPIELTEELAKEKGLSVDLEGAQKAMLSHQEKSREGAEKKFAGGLADHSEIVVKYHTATHLLHAALRKILGSQVRQVGSNLTAERLRFDFTYPQKMTEGQLNRVENLINQKISEGLPVKEEVMSLKEAQKRGSLAFFGQKYGEMVKVYTIGDFSKEVCGGPHVKNTKEIGKIKIFKEESVGVGKRRIYARIVE
jgi:alanyl-tRNA synthetase